MGKRMTELYHQLMFERRMLLGCTVLVGLSVVLWVVAISTDYWFWVSAPTPNGIYVNETKRFFLSSHSGLWRICRRAMVVTQPGDKFDPETNSTITVVGGRTFFRKYHEEHPYQCVTKLLTRRCAKR
ncbi:hypothetical protein R5R35_010782 [Gryllus longicercus]|uniref:Uncharacterized protein n=1 Tax=Gryllus longicercus TaxID=2509291 RepID=A0AAN9Z649_9ORTH